jgi:hypothetical protein
MAQGVQLVSVVRRQMIELVVRYPTQWAQWAGPAGVERRLAESGNFSATGEFAFLNDWCVCNIETSPQSE